MLWINDLNKLKFTSIRPHAIHFKYDGEDYFIHSCDEFGESSTTLYKGRCKSNKNECVSSCWEEIRHRDLIKYDYNRKTLTSINKMNFVCRLYNAELIETKIPEIIFLVKEVTKLKKIIREQEDNFREISRTLRDFF